MISTRTPSGWLASTALAFMALCPLAAAQTAAPPARNGEAVPKFHRSYIPADEIAKGAWTQSYLPIDADDFRKLVEAVHAGATGAPGAGAALIERSEYTAKLVGDDLLIGDATLHLVRNSQTPGLLELAPWSPAIGAAHWLDLDAKPADLGTGPDGRCRVLVEGDRLRADWSLRAERTASGSMGFDFQVPLCPITRLSLDLPKNLELFVDRGIASEEEGPTPQTNRWTVELGGHRGAHLRIAAEGATPERRPLTLLRQATTYELSPGGVTARSQLILDVHGDPLQRIAVELDPQLRLIAARYGELQIPFAASPIAESGGTRVVLQLPEPIVGTGRVLQLSAMAPLTVGTRWRLPGIRADGMAWQEGTATLLIPGELVLEQLVTDGCQQSRAAALPAPASGESVEIQYFRPGASAEVLLGVPSEGLRIDSGATIEVGLNQVTARQAIVASSLRGDRRFIQADVVPSWTIDSVEDGDTNRALEWEIDDARPDRPRLSVRPEQSVSPTRAVKLIVRGHRPLPATPSFDSGKLIMLGFDEHPTGERLIHVRGIEGVEPKWSQDADLSRIDPLALSPEQLRLFSQPPVGALFATNGAFARSTVELERRRASYSADIRIDAAVHDDVLTETYTIQCTPETSRVDRLVVRFSQARDVPLEWNLAGANTGQFSARPLTEGEQSQVGLPAGGEAWEVTVQLARPGPFELRAVRSTELKELQPLSLAQVAQAAVQRGTLTIRAVGSADIAIQNRRLSAVPAELLEADRYQTARATYHFQPGRDDLGAEAAVSVASARPIQGTSGAWVWNSRLDSRFAGSDTAVHWATLRIQTAGAQRIHIRLPDHASLHGAWIDEERMQLVLTAGERAGFTVDLPPGRAFAALTLYYATPGGLPAMSRVVEAALPQVDIPVVASQWTVWLPPGYEIPETTSRFPIDGLPPLTLTQRLFGILGRDARTETFNPLVANDWRDLAAGDDADAESASGRQFVESLGTRMSEYLAGAAEVELNWGQLLSLCAEDVAASGHTLLIDADSLSWLQLGPQQRVRFQPGESPVERGTAQLRQSGLGVLVWRDVMALTASTTIASESRQIEGRDHGVIFSVAEGPLADELDRAARPGADSRYRPLAAWQNMPGRGAPPWSATVPAIAGLRDAGGWRAYTVHASQAEAPRLRIVRTAAVQSLAWPIFLAMVAVGIWRRNRPPASLLILGTLAGLSALLLPAAYANLGSAAFLGALVCLVLRLIRFRPREAPKRESPSRSGRSHTIPHPVAGLLLATAICASSVPRILAQPLPAAPIPDAPLSTSATSAAQQAGNEAPRQANEPAAPAAPIYRVFVPVDDQQQPDGDKYYVPTELYKRLSRLASSASGKPKDWLVTRAAYRGDLMRDPVTKQLRLAQLKATFDLTVLSAQAEVRLPFPHDVASDAVLGARLDGRAIPMKWTPAGDALDLGTLPGERYRLELDLQSRLRAYGASAGFDVAIPPMTGAEVVLTVPPDAPTIEVPTARGRVDAQKEQGRIQAHLGASDRLSVRWPAGIGMETALANIEVEELIWVKVRPGTTVFDVRFKYRVLEGGMRQIRMLADPRLQLLPSTDSATPITSVHVIPGDPQRIDLELSRSVSDQVTIDLSFLLTGTSGVGNLQFPRLESSGVRAAHRCLAVTVDAALESKEFPGEDTQPMAIADYMTAWGAAEARPQAAYRIPRGEAMWVLATQPSEPRTRVDQSLTLGLEREVSAVEFEAALSIDGGYLFQLRLDSTAEFAIEQVSLIDEGVQRVARWSTDKSGRTTVFLTGPITGNHTVMVRGRVKSPASGTFAIPGLKFVDANVERSRWRIHRQSGLKVDIRPGAGVTASALEERESHASFGALVGVFQSDDPHAAITAEISANTPQVSAVVVTTLERDGDRWMAELHGRVNVAGGLVDALSFEVPPQWAEPYRVAPPARTALVPIPGEPRSQLLVYPAEPIEDQFEFKIRGRVALTAGDRLRVPDIVPQRVDRIERYVVLPERLDLQQISWETVGLTRAALPPEFAASNRDRSATVAYRVDGQGFQAALRGVQRTAATARIKLADVKIVWQADGYYQGVASFDMEPAGATRCDFELPAGHQLVHASIESLPAQLVELGENRWRAALGPAHLPQRLEIVFRGPYSGSGGYKRFAAPRLPELQVDETMWTVYSPDQFTVASVGSAARSVDAAEQELNRLRAIAALAQLPAEILGEHLPEEISRWYQPWRKRYAAASAAFVVATTTGSKNGDQSAEVLEARQLDARIDAIDARLAPRTANSRAPTMFRAPSELLVAWQTSSRPARFLADRDTPTLELYYSQQSAGGWSGQVAAAVALLAAAVAALVLLRGRTLPKFAPGMVVTAIGVTWWLLLAPSIAGLAVVLLGIWLALREHAPGTRQAAPR